MSSRVEKGREIAVSRRITRLEDGRWKVPSSKGGRFYFVDLEAGSCTCRDNELRLADCCHIYATRFAKAPGSIEAFPRMEVTRPTYQQQWPAYEKAKCGERGYFEQLASWLASGVDESPAKVGRPNAPNRDLAFGAILKVYLGQPGRMLTTDLARCHERGLTTTQPHHTTIAKWLRSPDTTPVLQQLIQESARPLAGIDRRFNDGVRRLSLAMDATGFRVNQYGRWQDVKKKPSKDWNKLHMICGTATHVVIAAFVTEASTADVHYLGPLLDEAAKLVSLDGADVSADKGYLSLRNVVLAENHAVNLFCPFKKDSRKDRGLLIWRKLFHFFEAHHDEWLHRYGQRSNSEAVFSMIKRRFQWGRLRSRNETSRINEGLAIIVAHNICVLVQEMFERGVTPEFWGGSMPSQLAKGFSVRAAEQRPCATSSWGKCS